VVRAAKAAFVTRIARDNTTKGLETSRPFFIFVEGYAMTKQADNPSQTLALYADGPAQLEAVLTLEMQASHVAGHINDIQMIRHAQITKRSPTLRQNGGTIRHAQRIARANRRPPPSCLTAPV